MSALTNQPCVTMSPSQDTGCEPLVGWAAVYPRTWPCRRCLGTRRTPISLQHQHKQNGAAHLSDNESPSEDLRCREPSLSSGHPRHVWSQLWGGGGQIYADLPSYHYSNLCVLSGRCFNTEPWVLPYWSGDVLVSSSWCPCLTSLSPPPPPGAPFLERAVPSASRWVQLLLSWQCHACGADW